jgi:hypothetical protein
MDYIEHENFQPVSFEVNDNEIWSNPNPPEVDEDPGTVYTWRLMDNLGSDIFPYVSLWTSSSVPELEGNLAGQELLFAALHNFTEQILDLGNRKAILQAGNSSDPYRERNLVVGQRQYQVTYM